MASGLHFVVLICLMGVLWIVPSASCASVGCTHCPSGWTLAEGRCYLFDKNTRSWTDSELFCLSQGGNLASFHSADEYNSLRAFILKTSGGNTRSWVGGHDGEKDGVWLWTDGSKLSFTSWGKGEPNGGDKERCMEINFNGKNYVNDEPCAHKRACVCVINP